MPTPIRYVLCMILFAAWLGAMCLAAYPTLTAASSAPRLTPFQHLPSTKSGSDPCPVTEVTAEKPANQNTAQWSKFWYKSTDGKLWASSPGRWTTGGVKVLWEKPAGSRLSISGRRLDGSAPPLEASIPEGYAGDYQASGLDLPTGGCWQVSAHAGSASLRFIVKVLPRIYEGLPFGCPSFASLVRSSAAVVVARHLGTVGADDEMTWDTIEIEDVWTGQATLGKHLDLLRDNRYEPTMMPENHYLLFLNARPGYPWRILCADITLAEVSGKSVRLVSELARGYEMWSGSDLAEIKEQVSSLAKK